MTNQNLTDLKRPDSDSRVIGSGHKARQTLQEQQTKTLRSALLRNKLAVVGLLIFVALILMSLFGGMFSQWSYDEPDFLNLATEPGPEHIFGTTDGGHDLYAQTVHGLGRSLIIAVLVSLATSVLSALIGAGAALYGGSVEDHPWVIHFLLAIPSFLLIALITSDAKGDWKILIVVLIAFGWMYPARVIWSLAYLYAKTITSPQPATWAYPRQRPSFVTSFPTLAHYSSSNSHSVWSPPLSRRQLYPS